MCKNHIKQFKTALPQLKAWLKGGCFGNFMSKEREVFLLLFFFFFLFNPLFSLVVSLIYRRRRLV